MSFHHSDHAGGFGESRAGLWGAAETESLWSLRFRDFWQRGGRPFHPGRYLMQLRRIHAARKRARGIDLVTKS